MEGSFCLVKPIMGETLRAHSSSSLDFSPTSLARTPSIRQLTQRAGANNFQRLPLRDEQSWPQERKGVAQGHTLA